MCLAACLHVLADRYGYLRSFAERAPVDGKGNPLPLYTYPAIEYLKQFDYSRRSVFEFGSGYSTLFWMGRARRVVALEHDAKWHARLKERVADNVTLLLREPAAFPQACAELAERFDIVVIDNAGNRYRCAETAVQALAPGGMIILDNADWHPNTAAALRDNDLIQVDMTGFKSFDHFTSTTSLFLHRQFNFTPREGRQPHPGTGAKGAASEEWDRAD